jgi:hypothetical protein
MDKLLQVLVSQYQAAVAEAQGHVELELRCEGLDSDGFISLYNRMKDKQGVVEHTINIISDTGDRDYTKLIRTIKISNGEVTSDMYSKKRRYKAPMTFPGDMKIRAGISIESSAAKFNSATNAVVRFKNRISWDLGRWRLDMTAVRQHTLSQISTQMKAIRDEMFPVGQTAENYIELLPDSATSYEVELEFIGTNLTAADFATADVLLGGETGNEAYQSLIRKIADVIYPPDVAVSFSHKSNRLKQLGNQVMSLSRNQYYSEIWPPVGYLVTDKADGLRCMVYCEGDKMHFLLSDKMMSFGGRDGKTNVPVTIADAELLGDRIFVFDVLMVEGKAVADLPMSTRIGSLDRVVETMKGFDCNVAPSAKKYVTIQDGKFEEGFSAVWNQPRDYTVDGLIISSPVDGYVETKNYKWKPMDQNTIDFLAIKCPSGLLGIHPYDKIDGKTLYLLFVGISRGVMSKIGLSFIKKYKSVFPITEGAYFPIQFSPSANPYAYLYYDSRDDLDRKIVELVREAAVDTAAVADEAKIVGSMMPGEWKLVRVRDDRKMESNYFGNDFRVAEITYMNHVDPFYFEDLWKSQNTYFRGVASTIYEASNKFKRYVISVVMKDHFTSARRVVDLAAGRGADLHRLMELNVREAIFVDIDPTAISELIRRKFAFFKQRQRTGRRYHGRYDDNFETAESMIVHAMVADLKTPYEKTIGRMRDFGALPGSCDGAVCNFAFHYMCDTNEHIHNFLQLVGTLLAKDGVLMITVMDGQRVFDLLADLKTGEQWTAMAGERPQYAIKKKFTGANLAKYGQTISVLLPFSDEMYDEPLCNVANLTVVAKKYNLALELSLPFNEYLEQFSRADSSLFGRLTDVDKHYIGLHQMLTFRKIK